MDLDDMAVVEDEEMTALSSTAALIRPDCQSPRPMVRSLSDGASSTPARPSELPFLRQGTQSLRSKDDSSLLPRSSRPATPLRPLDVARTGLTLQMPAHRSFSVAPDTRSVRPPPISCPSALSIMSGCTASAAAPSGINSPVAVSFLQAPFMTTRSSPAHTPTSPKFDHSQIFSSPTSVVSRRSRGLDFSRAATSLHHSMLADRSSPESSPVTGGGRFPGAGPAGPPSHVAAASLAATGHATSSLWSMMGSQERLHLAASQGSLHPPASDPSSSSEDNDFLDEDMEEVYTSTPTAALTAVSTSSIVPVQPQPSFGTSLLSYQRRRRPRKQPTRRLHGPLGLGFSPNPKAARSRSPPTALGSLGSFLSRDRSDGHARRESISWHANRLHLSSSESEESVRQSGDVNGGWAGQADVAIRKTVTRRGNLLPRTKNFARIRAALAEEGAPAETELRREAEVLRHVRDGDSDLERQMAAVPPISTLYMGVSFPQLADRDGPDEQPDVEMGHDPTASLALLLRQRALRDAKARSFWDTFSDGGSSGGGSRATPPPALFPTLGLDEDVSMNDSSSPATRTGTGLSTSAAAPLPAGHPPIPTVAEITGQIHSKRRRDDDLDPLSFKRRAVSPGVSVHGSPVPQSPVQRDFPWGSRPGSKRCDRLVGGCGGSTSSGSTSGDGLGTYRPVHGAVKGRNCACGVTE